MSDEYAELLHSWKVEEDEKLKDQTNGLKAVSNTTNVEPIQTREELYKSWEQEESAKGKASLDRAVTTNPDQYAETLSLSGKAGLPVDTVERNLDDIKNRERVKEIDYDSLAYKSPALAESLKDIEFGKVSHDQIENLSFLEDASKKLDPKTWFDRGDWLRNKSDAFNSAIAIAAGSSLSGTGTFLQIMKDENVDRDPIIENYKKSKMFGGMVGFGILGFAAEPLQKIGDTIKEFGQSIVPERMTYADQVVSGLGQLSTQAVTFAINPTAATGLMWGQGIDIQKDKIKEAGDLDHDYAEVEMLAGGAIIAVTEFLATKYHLGPSAKLGLKNKAYDVIATTLSSGAVEAVQETSESIIRDVTNILMTNPDGEIGIEQAFEEGGVAATVGFIFQTIISGGRYAKARKTQQAFENLSDAVKAQELRDRSPEAFNSFAERVAQNMADQTDGALTDVYIDSEIFNQIMNDAGIDRDFIIEQYPELKEQLEETDSTSGDLRLPMKDWIGSVAGTDIGDALMPHIRASESDLSVAELDIAESMRPSIEERFEEAKKEQTDNKAFKQSASAVRKSVYEQIKSTGVYSDSVSRQYASLMSNFFVTQARETGKTPQEMYDKYPIKIRREFDLNNGDDVTAVLNQAKTSGYEGNVAGEALEWVRASEKGLDMSLEGRMARAREMGFDVDEVFYHGTGQDFRAFDPKQGGKNYGIKNDNGLVWVTKDSGNAWGKADDAANVANDGQDWIAAPNGDVQGTYPGSRVMPLIVRNSNTLVESIDNATWPTADELMAGGYDSYRIIDGESGGGDDVAIVSGNQIRSVNAAFDPDFADSANILAQSVSLRKGTETLKRFGLDPNEVHKTRDIAAALETRQREKYGKIDRDDRSPEASRKIADWMVQEVLFELENPESSGAGWYSDKFQRALDAFAVEFPELATDKTARDTFTALIAVTSDGQKVMGNFVMAEDIYRNFRESGKLETDKGTRRNASVKKNLKVLQSLFDEMGAQKTHEYLMEEMTVGELKRIAREHGTEFKSDYKVDVTMPRAALELGPKLGAFYANLMGSNGYLTMDLWWSRTFNRYRGLLLQSVSGTQDNPVDSKGRKIGLAKFKELIGEPDISDDQALAKTVELADSYKKKGYKKGTQEERSANTLYKQAFENIEDAPFNAGDRSFMLEAVEKAAKSLARKGHETSIADIQAILWYYEKRLYGDLGARKTADISYEEAAKKIVSDRTEGRSTQTELERDIPIGEEVYNQGQVQDEGRLNQQAVPRIAKGNSTGSEFEAALSSARKLNKNGASVAQYEVSEYNDMSTFLLDEGRAGYAIEDDGNLVGVFKSPDSTMSSALSIIVDDAIKNGATKLNAFEGFLTEQYKKHGFVEVARDSWDEKYRPDNWTKQMGTPDVVYMELQNAETTNARQIQDESRVRGSDGLLSKQSEQNAQREEDGSLRGLPRKIGEYRASHYNVAEEVARKYARSAGIDYRPPSDYVSVDPVFASRVAQAFEQARHNPQDPQVAESYQALIEETLAQYEAILDSGLEVEFIDFDKIGDPYEGNPRSMIDDVRENNHMWVFATTDGFGSSDVDISDNPLLASTQFKDINGKPMVANDVFRVVHDYFGHVKEGVGFRASGEENAFRMHSAMFSPLARRALTSETRGQNSWVNYGPEGSFNRTASASDTIYADQKVTLLPEWASLDPSQSGSFNQQAIPQTETNEFREWAGTDEIVESDEINDHDFSGDEPTVLRVYHATTHEFDTFDTSVKGNLEGHFGKVNYFTSSEYDAEQNYAGRGPDLTLRIDTRAEQLAQSIEEQFDEMGRQEVVDSLYDSTGELRIASAQVADMDNADAAYEIAKVLAGKELDGGESKVMEVFVKTNKPFVVRGRSRLEEPSSVDSPFMEFFDLDAIREQAVEQVAEDNDITVEEVLANEDDYIDEIYDAQDLQMEDGNPLFDAIETVSAEYDVDEDGIIQAIYDFARDGVDQNTLEAMLRNASNESYVTDEEGNLAPNDFVARVIQELGYDSIILKDADAQFSSMGMERGTTHVHVFDANNTNVKSATDNSGAFDPKDPNIYKQSKGGKFYSAVERAVAGMNIPGFKVSKKNPDGKARGSDVWAKLIKSGVKKEEYEWLGLEEFLTGNEDARFTRTEVVDFIKDNGVQVETNHLNRSEGGELSGYEDMIMEGDYSDYRDIQLTLPSIEEDFYYVEHFLQRNVLSFMRVTDREIDGKGKAYFIEELQSDWHQQGRKEGYKTGRDLDEINAEYEEAYEQWESNFDYSDYYSDYYKSRGINNGWMADQTVKARLRDVFESDQDKWPLVAKQYSVGSPERTMIDAIISDLQSRENLPEIIAQYERVQDLFGQELTEEDGVPNAPFKGDSWLRLSLKKALVDAVESGADSFSWSSGEILKKRYERSGTTTLFENQYNKKMPSIVESLTKQKPERVSNGNATNPEDVWVVPITDELKASIESEGFSLFQATGDGTRGGFNPETMTVTLGEQSDYSTFVHEASHFFLEVYADLATNGEPKYQKDFNIILDWMGVESIEAWNNMTLDQKRQYHEQFAYNYEIYTFEGKSPSVEMQTLFDKFSAWMRRVYESIRDELNAAYKKENGKDLPMLTGEIRQVMDRMLASEKQIEQAQLVRSAVPIFQTQGQSGMNDQEWEEYQVMAQEQNDAANSSLARSTARQIQWLENAKSKVIKGIQAKSRAARKLVKEEVTKQVKSERVYAVQQFVRYGDIGQSENTEPKKISSQMLKDMYEGVEDAPDLRGLGYGKGGMVGRDGIDPEIVAQIYGFESADQMIREILSSRKLKDEISARTDQRMLEEYSEYSDPKAIEDAVTKALHSEARAKFMAVELRHLMKSTQPYRVMQKAAQTAAQSILRGKKISDIRPKMYEAAESKAAKEVLLLMKKGDSEGAVAAKQRELLNHHLVKESTAMLESVDKAQAKFKRLLGKGAQKNMRGDFLEQLNALLERFDLRKSVSKAQMGERPPLRDFIQDQARKLSAVAPDIAAWILNSDSKQHYKTLTIDEFSDLVDAVDMLENMARREQKMYMAVRNMTFQQEREAILAELEEANPDTFEDGKPNRYVKHDKTARAERWWNNKSKFDGEFINFETLLDVATKGGGKAIFESLFNRLSQAADNKNEFMIHLGQQLKEVGAAYSARERYEFTRKKPIVTSTGRYMTRENRIAVALYYGSETGRQRLAEGNNFTDLEIKEIINSLDEKDVNLMKEMWRINDEIIWPKLRDLNKRTAGKAPEKVGALPFQTRFGVVQGGYVPIAYDSDLSVRQEELDLANSVDEMLGITDNGRAQTRQGSSKERLDVVKDPLDLTLTGMERKMNETIHDITHREAVVDTYRLLSDKNVATALKNAIGHGAYQAMTQAIREVAVKPKPLNSSSDKVVTYLRNSTLINLMGASVNTTLLNVLGVLPAMNRVGPLRFAKHLGKLHYMKRSEWIYEKSQYMKNRLTSYDRDLNEEHARMVGKNGYMPSMAFWFAGLSMMDRAVTIPTWAAAYEKGMEVYKNDEVAAVTYADRVVRQSQSAARPVDLAHVSSRQHLKIFTMFYGFFSSMLGTMRRTHAKAGKQMSDKEYAKATMALASAYLMNIIRLLLFHAWNYEKDACEGWQADERQGVCEGNYGTRVCILDEHHSSCGT